MAIHKTIGKSFTAGKKTWIFGLVCLLLTEMGCAPAVVTPLPPTVRRIAVLPPYRLGTADIHSAATDVQASGLPSRTIGDLLAQQARAQLAEKGLEVLDPIDVKVATRGRIPTSPQIAAQIMEEARLDATALYIEVRRWEPTPDSRGMKADGVIVALNVVMVDPKTGTILWQVQRPARPVTLYGVVLTGQAHLFVAETVMKEVFAHLGSRKPGTRANP